MWGVSVAVSLACECGGKCWGVNVGGKCGVVSVGVSVGCECGGKCGV